MIDLIRQHRLVLSDICRKYDVKRLDLIGSAARGDFAEERSDLDFLVEFEDGAWQGSPRQYFGLLHALEDLFQRHIDLIERSAVESPLFLEVAEKDRELVYAG